MVPAIHGTVLYGGFPSFRSFLSISRVALRLRKRALSWQETCELRRRQLEARKASQPRQLVLFELKEDCCPADGCRTLPGADPTAPPCRALPIENCAFCSASLASSSDRPRNFSRKEISQTCQQSQATAEHHFGAWLWRLVMS